MSSESEIMYPSQFFPDQGESEVISNETNLEPAMGNIAAPETHEIDSVENRKSWLARHKVGVGIGTLAVGAAAIAAPEVAETAAILKENAAWTVPSLIGTEVLWNSGAATMLYSAGKKIGNPLKIRERMDEIIASVSKSKVFRAGLGVNIAGELGTASIITAGSVAELPPSTWPLTIGSAALLMVPGVSLWAGVYRANKNLPEESK